MFPWTHAAFGYLLLAGLAVLLRRRVSRAELATVVVATQLPDLVDKPLAWHFNVIPSGRSFAHSLLVAVPLSVAILAVAWYRSHGEVGVAFWLGYLSHLYGDVDGALSPLEPEKLTFLLWPVLPPYPTNFSSVPEALRNLDVTEGTTTLFVAASAVGLLFLAHFLRAPWWRSPRPR